MPAKKATPEKPEISEKSEKSTPVITLGPRDSFDNMPATIDGAPSYVYRDPAGVWKSVGAGGSRRRFGAEMSAALEAVYARQSEAEARIESLQILLDDTGALEAIGRRALRIFIDSGFALGLAGDRPWVEIEVNPFNLSTGLRETIAQKLRERYESKNTKREEAPE